MFDIRVQNGSIRDAVRSRIIRNSKGFPLICQNRSRKSESCGSWRTGGPRRRTPPGSDIRARSSASRTATAWCTAFPTTWKGSSGSASRATGARPDSAPKLRQENPSMVYFGIPSRKQNAAKNITRCDFPLTPTVPCPKNPTHRYVHRRAYWNPTVSEERSLERYGESPFAEGGVSAGHSFITPGILPFSASALPASPERTPCFETLGRRANLVGPEPG